MPKIKICVIDNVSRGFDESDTEVLREGITDWEEISEENLSKLRQYLWTIQPRNGRAVIVQQEDNVKLHISNIDNWIKEQDRKKAAEQKRRDRESKERKNKAEERKRKQYEKLKQEFEKGN